MRNTMTDIDTMTTAELRAALAMTEADLEKAREKISQRQALADSAGGGGNDPLATATATKPAAPAADQIPLRYSCTHDWVYGWLTAMTRKPLMRWCDQWDQHDEAVVRLTALWQSWETARANPDPQVMSRWILEHLDKHMAVLTSVDGPFTECGRQGHTLPRAAVPPEDAQISVPERQLQRA